MNKNNKATKIGIVTWFFSGNYGSNLQALALYDYLSLCGFECSLIGMPKKSSSKFKNILKEFCPNFIFDLRKMKNMKNSNKWIKIKKEFANIDIDRITNIKQLNNGKYEYLISGSDQIWNPYFLNPFFLLDFPTTAKKVAYSSGFGVTTIPNEYDEVYKNAFKSFSNIAVREGIGKDYINSLLKIESIKLVVDPVFLLSRNQWISWINNFDDKYNFKNYLLCYFVGQRKDYIKYVQEISNHLNISKIVIINSVENPILFDDYIILNDVGNSDFIKLIQNSKYIITDSFHATAFAIIFGKNFSEMLRFDSDDIKSQNNRILELLERYDLKNRIFDYTGLQFCKKNIDYVDIYKKVENSIESSKQYLEKALEV